MKIFKMIITFISGAESFSWIGLANQKPSSAANQKPCESSSLSFIQRRLCKMNSQFEPALAAAAKYSMKICSESMVDNGNMVAPTNRKWDSCFEDMKKLPFMNPKLKKPTAESAYLHGLSSGQLITAAYKLCQSGSISDSDARCDINHVSNFVTEFTSIMSIVKRKKSVAEIEIHNAKIGQKLAWKTQKSLCKCHGTSGSCTIKTCFETAPLAEHLGKLAFEKYSKSIGIQMPRNGLPSEITNLLANDDFLFVKN